MVVIADTIPINYPVLIGEQELLPALFGQIIIPEAVFRELHAAVTPQPVQQWLASIPFWLEIRKLTAAPDATLFHLDEGERGDSTRRGVNGRPAAGGREGRQKRSRQAKPRNQRDAGSPRQGGGKRAGRFSPSASAPQANELLSFTRRRAVFSSAGRTKKSRRK